MPCYFGVKLSPIKSYFPERRIFVLPDGSTKAMFPFKSMSASPFSKLPDAVSHCPYSPECCHFHFLPTGNLGVGGAPAPLSPKALYSCSLHSTRKISPSSATKK